MPVHDAVETCKGASQISSLLDGSHAALSPKQWCVSWVYGRLNLITGLLVAARSGGHYCCYVGRPASGQIHVQAYIIAFFSGFRLGLKSFALLGCYRRFVRTRMSFVLPQHRCHINIVEEPRCRLFSCCISDCRRDVQVT